MLAWVHQTVASEKELLLSLLQPHEAVPMQEQAPDIEGIDLFVLLDKVTSNIYPQQTVHVQPHCCMVRLMEHIHD